jgi:hypothetical protein
MPTKRELDLMQRRHAAANDESPLPGRTRKP